MHFELPHCDLYVFMKSQKIVFCFVLCVCVLRSLKSETWRIIFCIRLDFAASLVFFSKLGKTSFAAAVKKPVTARIMGVVFALLSGGLSSSLPPLRNTHTSCRYTSRHATSGITAQPWPWAPLWNIVTATCFKTLWAHPLPLVFTQCTFSSQLHLYSWQRRHWFYSRVWRALWVLLY